MREAVQIEKARLRAAYAECERLTRAHYENFPVASWLLPGDMRPHVAALYAFARMADDFADEGRRTGEDRLRLLDDWQNRLHACVEDDCDPDNPIFLALGATIRARSLPIELFDDLLSAFRQDITTHRYPSWNAVLEYCSRSANPVGRLVLRIGGYEDGALDTSSDALCTALQLTNFWQDLDRDWQRGRLYVPLDDVEACYAHMQDLDDRRLTEPWKCALTRVAARTRELFGAGRHVCDGVRGRLRQELRLTWLGGVRILDRLERAEYDVFTRRPTLGVKDAPSLAWRVLWWRSESRKRPPSPRLRRASPKPSDGGRGAQGAHQAKRRGAGRGAPATKP